ncbi:MAG: hypothetical protein ACJA06_000151 [Halocynthiibacter sp.]
MRKLIIFGNGLGRALDNDFFDLETRMREVWADENCLTPEQKRLIATSIEGVEPEEGPSSEDQLGKTQMALVACEVLGDAVNDGQLVHWLTVDARDFPSALKKYLFEVARSFHGLNPANAEYDFWQDFKNELVKFIWTSKSHVATLNYDDLLYDPFNDVQEIDGVRIHLCDGYNGVLLDGYTHGRGFSKLNMEPDYYPENFGYYMHLHGSPLFVEGDEHAIKLKRRAMRHQNVERDSHIVLTHKTFKPLVIKNSPVLSMYWEKLDKAIDEASEIILFGYSGLDEHLNAKISARRGKIPVRVVERTHEEADMRADFWKRELGVEATIVQFDNILDFREWAREV